MYYSILFSKVMTLLIINNCLCLFDYAYDDDYYYDYEYDEYEDLDNWHQEKWHQHKTEHGANSSCCSRPKLIAYNE